MNPLFSYSVSSAYHVSEAMTKYKYIGRPIWMFMEWVPFRVIRFLIVKWLRIRWLVEKNKRVIRNRCVLKLPNGPFIMDKLTYNQLMNEIPIRETFKVAT